jgi:hypothetical protein
MTRRPWLLSIHPTVREAVERRAWELGISSSQMIEQTMAERCEIPPPPRRKSERAELYDHPCPTCWAAEGETCRTSGDVRTAPHAARKS